MNKVVFIASGWGAKYGGVNAFNYDLVCALAEYFKNDILPICIVEEATAEEVKEASKFEVELLHTNGRFSAANITKVLKDNGHDDISCWIGHDIITGNEAIECCDIYREYLGVNCISGVIHHMDYLTYYTTKTNDGIAALSKHNLQKKIFTTCDLVYAVGPFLKNSVENMLREAEIDNEVIELIPGLADLKNCNINSPFKAISYGRLGDEDEIVKQGKLAVAAFSKACQDEQVNESSLTVIGLDDNDLKEKQKELFSMGHQYGGKLYNIIGLPYMNRSDIYTLLKTQSASMMLSIHEGFGLAGWEAISAEIPLILSIDTGLYKFLDAHLGGAGTGCFFPVKITGNIENDLPIVSKALLQIKQDLNRARRNAQSLKKQLFEFNWQATADQFISHVLLNIELKQLDLDSSMKAEKLVNKESIKIPGLMATSESVTQSTTTIEQINLSISKWRTYKQELNYNTSTFYEMQRLLGNVLYQSSSSFEAIEVTARNVKRAAWTIFDESEAEIVIPLDLKLGAINFETQLDMSLLNIQTSIAEWKMQYEVRDKYGETHITKIFNETKMRINSLIMAVIWKMEDFEELDDKMKI